MILMHGGRERIVAPDRGEILEFGMNCAGGARRPRIGSMHEVIEDVVRPDLVINTAAAHNVPACEDMPAEAYAVNATGVAALAASCARIGARLVHVSTDYVFGETPPRDAS